MSLQLSENTRRLISILNDGLPHTGPSIGDALGVSRAAVWKIIGSLEKLGLAIERDSTYGYVLTEPCQLLDANIITQQLDIKTSICLLNQVDSTIEYLKKHPPSSPLLCLAESQTGGKGRLNRSWQTPFASGIACSYLWQTYDDVSQLGGLSLVVSLAIVSALENYGIRGLKVKWPNDIYYQDKKLAGILVNFLSESHGLTQVIISFGLNVNLEHPNFAALSQITQQRHNRNDILPIIINKINQFITNPDLLAYQKLWKQYDYLVNKPITVNNFKQTITGVAKGINPQGLLCVETADGSQCFSAGDVTLSKQ